MVSNISRLLKELTKLKKNVEKLTIGQVMIEAVNNSTNSGDMQIQFIIRVTPKEGHYQGAAFRFQVEIPSTYPIKAPYVSSLNKVYHPNIDLDDGAVCVNLLDRDWQPQVGLDGCVMAVLFLFYHPNFLDALSTAFDGGPMDEEVFHTNVRASLRGEIIEGVQFDKLLEEAPQMKTIDESPETNRVTWECVEIATHAELFISDRSRMFDYNTNNHGFSTQLKSVLLNVNSEHLQQTFSHPFHKEKIEMNVNRTQNVNNEISPEFLKQTHTSSVIIKDKFQARNVTM